MKPPTVRELIQEYLARAAARTPTGEEAMLQALLGRLQGLPGGLVLAREAAYRNLRHERWGWQAIHDVLALKRRHALRKKKGST